MMTERIELPAAVESILDLDSPPVVGRTYLVPVVEVTYAEKAVWIGDLRYVKEPERIIDYPVLDKKLHSDVIGKTRTGEHWHIDARFLSNDELELLCLSKDKSVAWIGDSGYGAGFIFDKESRLVKWKERECRRALPRNSAKGPVIFGAPFRSDFEHSKMKCRTCPHKGMRLASMPIKDGKITCPMHGLTFDAVTEECVSWGQKPTGERT